MRCTFWQFIDYYLSIFILIRSLRPSSKSKTLLLLHSASFIIVYLQTKTDQGHRHRPNAYDIQIIQYMGLRTVSTLASLVTTTGRVLFFVFLLLYQYNIKNYMWKVFPDPFFGRLLQLMATHIGILKNYQQFRNEHNTLEQR